MTGELNQPIAALREELNRRAEFLRDRAKRMRPVVTPDLAAIRAEIDATYLQARRTMGMPEFRLFDPYPNAIDAESRDL